MNFDTILGLAMIVSALGLMAALVFWSCRSIHRIESRGPRSARRILRESPADEGDDHDG